MVLIVIFLNSLLVNLPNVSTVHRIWLDKNFKHDISWEETHENSWSVLFFCGHAGADPGF